MSGTLQPVSAHTTHAFYSTGSHGAASEMLACAYLLRQGYHVFRSISPACPVDGVAYKDGQCLRFEVKSTIFKGQRLTGLGFPKNDEWDLLIVVATHTGEVHQFRAPQTYEQVRDSLRAHYGLPPGPMGANRRGTGSASQKRAYIPRLVEHGTWAGYCRHKSQRTDVCGPCDEARGRHVVEQRARREAKEASLEEAS